MPTLLCYLSVIKIMGLLPSIPHWGTIIFVTVCLLHRCVSGHQSYYLYQCLSLTRWIYPFDMVLIVLGGFIPTGITKCSRLILCFSSPGPGIDHLPKFPWLLSVGNDIGISQSGQYLCSLLLGWPLFLGLLHWIPASITHLRFSLL